MLRRPRRTGYTSHQWPEHGYRNQVDGSFVEFSNQSEEGSCCRCRRKAIEKDQVSFQISKEPLARKDTKIERTLNERAPFSYSMWGRTARASHHVYDSRLSSNLDPRNANPDLYLQSSHPSQQESSSSDDILYANLSSRETYIATTNSNMCTSAPYTPNIQNKTTEKVSWICPAISKDGQSNDRNHPRFLEKHSSRRMSLQG